jgi:hypothetical protein
MYILEKNDTSPLCILCMLMPKIIRLLTLMLVRTWYEESTLGCKLETWFLSMVPYIMYKNWTSPCLVVVIQSACLLNS